MQRQRAAGFAENQTAKVIVLNLGNILIVVDGQSVGWSVVRSELDLCIVPARRRSRFYVNVLVLYYIVLETKRLNEPQKRCYVGYASSHH